MLGAILGDIIGSTYEFANTKDYNFDLFPAGSNYTDDTVLTVAVADAIINNINYGENIQQWARKYPHPKGAYGGSFSKWIYQDNPKPYNSFGNGSAMRVSPVGWLFTTEEEVLSQAKKSAECTHNHLEGIKGAQATAIALFFARKGKDKAFIKNYIEKNFGYNLDRSVDEIRKSYSFDVSCQGTVPESLICFLESTSFDDAIRNAISIGGDSDTIGAIVGGIAEAFYGIPAELAEKAESFLPNDMLNVIDEFRKRRVEKSSETSLELTADSKILQKRYSELKKSFSELFLQRQNMLQHEEPLLAALYLQKVGQKQYEAFCLNIELAKLKQEMSLLQAYINRNEKPNIRAVNAEIEILFKAYQEQIETEAQRLSMATEFLKSKFLSPEETQKVKEIYYIIVKRLHPDLNPNLPESYKELLVKAKIAYDMLDLPTLHEILLKLNLDEYLSGSIALPDLQEIVIKLEKNITKLTQQITELNEKFPFMYKVNLFNDEWIKNTNEETEKQISELKAEIEKTQTYVTLLKEWQPK